MRDPAADCERVIRVMLMPISRHPATLETETLLKQCEIRRGRRSGPGGQHRNKVETAIVIIHNPTGVRAEATERRSQEQNRRVAIARLRINLAVEVRNPCTPDDLPSELWQARCTGGRITISSSHEDFPVVLAEALDFVTASEFDVAAAACRLGSTSSQLVKLLKLESRALQTVNAQRQKRNVSRLR